jgi:hypothetical protein
MPPRELYTRARRSAASVLALRGPHAATARCAGGVVPDAVVAGAVLAGAAEDEPQAAVAIRIAPTAQPIRMVRAYGARRSRASNRPARAKQVTFDG